MADKLIYNPSYARYTGIYFKLIFNLNNGQEREEHISL